MACQIAAAVLRRYIRRHDMIMYAAKIVAAFHAHAHDKMIR